MEIIKCPMCGYSWKKRKRSLDQRIKCPGCRVTFVDEAEIQYREIVINALDEILSGFNRGLKSRSILRMMRLKGFKVSGPYISKLMSKEDKFYHEGPESGGVVKWKVIKQELNQ